MQLNGGLIEARRPFVLSEFGGGRLLQTGGQFQVAKNLFLHSRHAKQPVRYTIRGGTLTGPGSLRLADGQATDAIFRVEGTEPTIQLGRLIMASDRGVLEFLIDTSGVSPITVDQAVGLNDRGTLRLFSAAGDRPLPQQVVLLRYRHRHGQFARVELNGLAGRVAYDDNAGEMRLNPRVRVSNPIHQTGNNLPGTPHFCRRFPLLMAGDGGSTSSNLNWFLPGRTSALNGVVSRSP